MLAGDATTSGLSKSTSSLGDKPARLVHGNGEATIARAGNCPVPRELLADDPERVVTAGVVDDDDFLALQCR